MLKNRLIQLAVCLGMCFFGASASSAYWATGHHVIAVIAYELLEPQEREKLLRILRNHPRFEEDFRFPESIRGDASSIARWQFGAAGYWPDVIRSNEEWDRPQWHYQLGASLSLGDVDLPEEPTRLPEDATLESRELYVVQALKLCMAVLSDANRSNEDRAVALCWIAHLVADAHQPCHAGSLYAEQAFPGGDRGANGVEVTNGGNLHAVWDSMLGRDLTPNNVRRRVSDLMEDPALMVAGTHASDESSDLEPERWIQEGRTLANHYVYVGEVLTPIQHVERGVADELPPVTLTDEYLQAAGRVSELRAVEAGHRLARLLSQALATTDSE